MPIPAKIHLSALVAAAGVLAMAAGPALAAGAPDACKLVAPDLVTKIMGTPISAKPVDHGGGTNVSMCSYQGAAVGSGFMLIAAVLPKGDLAAEVASQKKTVADDAPPPGIEKPKVADVSGVGDAAFLVSSNVMVQLHVFARGDKLVISRNVPASPKAIAQEKQVAEAAIANLP